MKNIYFIVLLLLPSCYKKHIYEQYKVEKHGTVHYESPQPEEKTSSSQPIEIIDDSWLIGNAVASFSDSMDFSEVPIYCDIHNPSFEIDRSSHSFTPKHWENCGAHFESAIDIHTAVSSWFQVAHSSVQGNQFAGMVTRENGTHEAIGQVLDETLYAGKQYIFSFYVTRSENYISLSKATLREENFNRPIILKVKVGYDCKDMEVVGQTNLIESSNWEKYTIVFEPSEDSDFLILETSYEDEVDFPYNGNVLLDDLSAIYELPFKN